MNVSGFVYVVTIDSRCYQQTIVKRGFNSGESIPIFESKKFINRQICHNKEIISCEGRQIHPKIYSGFHYFCNLTMLEAIGLFSNKYLQIFNKFGNFL